MKSENDKKSWFKKHKLLTIVIVIVVIAIVASLGGGSDENGNSNNNNTRSYKYDDRADKQKNDVELALNEKGTVDGVELNVNSIEYMQSAGEYDNAKEGETYIKVNATLVNKSNGTKPYNVYDFRVQTAGGQVLDAAIVMAKTISSGDIVAGGTVTGDVYFEAPIEDSSQFMIWKPNAVKSDRAIVKLK